jgi:hypothetical protein
LNPIKEKGKKKDVNTEYNEQIQHTPNTDEQQP